MIFCQKQEELAEQTETLFQHLEGNQIKVGSVHTRTLGGLKTVPFYCVLFYLCHFSSREEGTDTRVGVFYLTNDAAKHPFAELIPIDDHASPALILFSLQQKLEMRREDNISFSADLVIKMKNGPGCYIEGASQTERS